MAEMGGGSTGQPSAIANARVLLTGSATLETPTQAALDRAIRSGQALSVLRLYLSRLAPGAARPYHARVARCLFDDAARSGGQVLPCGGGDLALIGSPQETSTLGVVLLRLFRAEAPGDRHLLGLWTLPDDSAALRAAFAETGDAPRPLPEPAAPVGMLAAVAAAVSTAPPGDLMRRQTAIRIERGRVSVLFHEVSLSFPALEARLGMRLPEEADPYLSRYMMGQSDERMLAALARADLSRVGALNVNLPLAGGERPGFAALRAAARRARVLLGVEVPLMEAVADLPRYTALRDAWQADGCSVVLDGIGPAALLQTDPAVLGADLIKLDWSAAILTLPARDKRRLARALEAVDASRVVLCRADTEAALLWGLEHGVAAFQGRHVDAMLAAERLRVCPHASGCSLRQCIDRAAATDRDGQSGCLDPALLAGVLHQPVCPPDLRA